VRSRLGCDRMNLRLLDGQALFTATLGQFEYGIGGLSVLHMLNCTR
jgi:hypothetical protein